MPILRNQPMMKSKRALIRFGENYHMWLLMKYLQEFWLELSKINWSKQIDETFRELTSRNLDLNILCKSSIPRPKSSKSTENHNSSLVMTIFLKSITHRLKRWRNSNQDQRNHDQANEIQAEGQAKGQAKEEEQTRRTNLANNSCNSNCLRVSSKLISINQMNASVVNLLIFEVFLNLFQFTYFASFANVCNRCIVFVFSKEQSFNKILTTSLGAFVLCSVVITVRVVACGSTLPSNHISNIESINTISNLSFSIILQLRMNHKFQHYQ